jgi:hypothetical protein
VPDPTNHKQKLVRADIDLELHQAEFFYEDGGFASWPLPWWLVWVNPIYIERRVITPPGNGSSSLQVRPEDPSPTAWAGVQFPDLEGRVLRPECLDPCSSGDPYALPVDLDGIDYEDHEILFHAKFIVAILEDRWYGRYGLPDRIPSMVRYFSAGDGAIERALKQASSKESDAPIPLRPR